jgi:CRISPR-associated endonuclease/helicase Cas3
MADESSHTSPSTRRVETSRGSLLISELAPLLAERVLRVQEDIESGLYSEHPITDDLIRQLHQALCGELVPAWAGQWRKMNVHVGAHEPPESHLVPLQMREYALNLDVQIKHSQSPERIPETLAFAEGRLLSIHPFPDFNGRITRLWLWELLRRLQLPPVTLAPSSPGEVQAYLNALRAGDRLDYSPLTRIWEQRLAQLSV